LRADIASFLDLLQLFNDAGIPIEPFHLRRERAEGYFDADGNYIEYVGLESADDAWLESLQVIAVTVAFMCCL